MSKEPLSLFHEHLLLFLQDDLHQKKSCEGWDEKTDPQLRSYHDVLSRSMLSSEALRLQEIIENYQHLVEKRGPVHLEHKLLEAFPDQEMAKLGLPSLRMICGLPRLYHKSETAILSKIAPKFSHLPSLKRAALYAPLYSLYADQSLPRDASVAIFAKEGADALLGAEIEKLFQQAFSFLNTELIVFTENGESLVSFEKLSSRLRGTDLLLQLSLHPKISGAIQSILGIDDPRPLPKVESLLKASSLEKGILSSHCMGLHFLQRGIFIAPNSLAIYELENEALLHWLFGQMCPGPLEIEEYRKKRRCFFAALSNQSSVFVYLHALLKSLEWDTKEIDLCISDPGPLFEYLESRLIENKPLFENGYGLAKIVLYFGKSTATIDIRPDGKTLCVLSCDSLCASDQLRLFAFSEDFVGIANEEGFRNVVGANKGFFFDPDSESRNLLKDLVALAENKIAAHRSTLNLLRLLRQAYKHRLPKGGGEWVDEIEIQCEEKMPLLEIAEKIGLYLQDPDAIAGFKKLNRIIAKEQSCNSFLLQMLQRAVCHRRCPQIARVEEAAVSHFAMNKISISHLVETVRDALF